MLYGLFNGTEAVIDITVAGSARTVGRTVLEGWDVDLKEVFVRTLGTGMICLMRSFQMLLDSVTMFEDG